MKKILVVSNMYPSSNDVSFGTFVKNCVSCLKQGPNFIVNVVKKEKTNNFIQSLNGYIKLYCKSFIDVTLFRHDIYYIHYTSHSCLGVLLGSMINKKAKLVSHVHGSDILQEESVSNSLFFIKKYLSEKILKKSDLVIVPSEYYKSVLLSEYEISESKVMVSPSGGVDTDIFKPSPEVKNNNDFVLGFVGRLTKDKGFDDFLSVIRSLENDKSFSFIIVGDGPMSYEAETASASSNVQYIKRVTQQSLPEIYNQLDVFIFPTKRKTESLGLVAIEAMACGVPVIAYDISGPKEYVNNDVNGFLVELGNKNGILEKVNYLAKSEPAFIESLNKEALSTASKYSKSSVSESMIKVFKDISYE